MISFIHDFWNLNIIYKFFIRHQLLYFLRFICLTLYSCLTFALSISHINSTYIHMNYLLISYIMFKHFKFMTNFFIIFNISLFAKCLSVWLKHCPLHHCCREVFAVFSFPSFQTIIIIFNY